MMKVSVIIPTYNRLEKLKRAVDSILEQTYKDFELIIVDDGSTDKTKEYFENFDAVKYIYQENKGVSSARNTGIKASEGEWLSFLDSDDEWLPRKLEKQIEFAENNENIKIIHSNEIWIRNGVRVNEMNKHKKLGGWIYQNSLPLCLISPSAVIIHSSVFNEKGLFDETYPYAEDYDLWLRLTPYYEIGFIEEPLIKKYGGDEDQLSRNWGLDEYRVKSLEKMIKNPDLNIGDKEKTLLLLKKKLKILEKGYRKHNRIKLADEFKEKLEYYLNYSL